MSTIRVFVNGRMLELPAGSAVREAVRLFDPTLGEGMATRAALVTDGRGIELAPADSLTNGAILRVVVRARRGADADA
ncbi:MAG TPA: hypothetical protein VFZ87_14245 [Gemmatimonadales bacterium]